MSRAAARVVADGDKLNAHYQTITALPETPGRERRADADYLNTCRSKGNGLEYDAAGRVSAAEAKEVREFAVELRGAVVAWRGDKHPRLSPWAK